MSLPQILSFTTRMMVFTSPSALGHTCAVEKVSWYCLLEWDNWSHRSTSDIFDSRAFPLHVWGITAELSRRNCNCTMCGEWNFAATQSARHSVVSHYIRSDEGRYDALWPAANYVKYFMLRPELAGSLDFAPTYVTAYQLQSFCSEIIGFTHMKIGVYLRFTYFKVQNTLRCRTL
jgi:hypothetical protein